MLVIEGLVKTFASGNKNAVAQHEVRAVDHVSLTVEQGELFTLLGPSGCGKTTTLRSVAGLERPDAGRIAVGDQVFFDGARKVHVPPNARGLGMVFQSYAIWPHMTVAENVSFPLMSLPRKTRPTKAVVEEKVERVLNVVDLTTQRDRAASRLSGGQQQRLALARALVMEPPLLLLDEPLSNLDAKLRESMRFELKRLQRVLGITTIYVTHDQSEALALSSRIAVMNNGAIAQLGRPRDIYERPSNRFVADFIGTSTFVDATVLAVDGSRVRLKTAVGELWAQSTSDLRAGEQVTLSIRPERVMLSTSASGSAMNELAGVIETRAFLGESVDHIVRIGDARLHNRSNAGQSIREGTQVYVCVDPDVISVIRS